MKFDRTCCIRYSDDWEVILIFRNQVNQKLFNDKLPYIFCWQFNFLPFPFVIYFCACRYILYLQSRHLAIYTYVQCAAVRTHRLLMREPIQKDAPLIMRATCHGNWPRYAGLQPVLRLACSFRGTLPANSATHINTFQCGNKNSIYEQRLTYSNVTVSIPMCLKIRYKNYISQTHHNYFSF